MNYISINSDSDDFARLESQVVIHVNQLFQDLLGYILTDYYFFSRIVFPGKNLIYYRIGILLITEEN